MPRRGRKKAADMGKYEGLLWVAVGAFAGYYTVAHFKRTRKFF